MKASDQAAATSPKTASGSAQDVLSRAMAYVQSELGKDPTGHDAPHALRVYRMAMRLGKGAAVDRQTVALAALLHDIADYKFHGGDTAKGPQVARAWMERNGVDPERVDKVCEIVATLSYKGAGVATPMATLEGQLVQDADRLDAMGAIGIARAFAYGGYKGRWLHDPQTPPALHETAQAYQTSSSTTVNHFYEKLLLLKDRMNTPQAKKIAEKRHRFMLRFLKIFDQEWGQ